MFVGIHALLAVRLQCPELEIEEDEGKAFTAAAQKVMRHYSVETTQKTLDIVAFLGTTGTIYGPRIVAINMRRSAERDQPQHPGSDHNIIRADFQAG